MCDSCDEIIQVGNSGTNGWSPIYANIEGSCDGSDVVVQQLVSWTGGTGLRPSYEGNTMTDAWLTANHLYLGDSGWVEVLCDATNILGATGPGGTDGATGETGPQGPAGEDACVQDISFNISVDGSEAYPATVTLNDESTECDPIYDVEFPTTAFTNNTAIDNHIESLAAELLLPDITSYTYVAGDVGTTNSYKIKYGTTSGSMSSFVLNTSTYNNMSYVQSKILGNTMFLNFRLFVDTVGTGTNTMYYIELLIPSSKTYANNVLNPIAFNQPGGTSYSSLLFIPVISSNASVSSRLKIGFYLPDSNIGGVAAGPSSVTQIFEGNIIFTIN